MASTFTSTHAAESYTQFNSRAPRYDAGNGGWHRQLGLDFVNWIKPNADEVALDLACGTGLVTIPLAAAIGSLGNIVAIDLSPRMLLEAQAKAVPQDSASISWIEGDITSLSSISQVQDVLQNRGGFDIITLCSALVLLHDQPAAIKHFSTFLKPGGRMIVDVPTDDKTLQYLFTVDLRQAVGIGMPFDRDWILGVHSLERLYKEAGLEIEASWRTKSYLPEKEYEADQAMEAFDEQIKTYKVFEEEGKLERARVSWPEIWKKNLTGDRLWDGHALYITIGEKPVS